MSRKVKDQTLQGLTLFCSLIGVLILGSILVYIFQKGFSGLNLDLIKNDYWSKNYLVAPAQEGTPGNFACASCSDPFSTSWGIELADAVASDGKSVVEVIQVDPESPLYGMLITTAGATQGQPLTLEQGFTIEKIDYVDAQGDPQIAGNILKQDAAAIVAALDSAQSVTSVYVKTPGGGIKGSLISTGWLILVSLLLSLPIGVASAIFLQEYAKKNRWTKLIRQGIEMLTGIPSIVYGLMGVSVLFPVTQVFGCTTTSILLGSITMAIILLPTIIRSTEEALLVVPKGLRDASLSLGATSSQTIFKVVLPCCLDGILTGVLLGVGRVIGESAALIYTMGTFINDTPTLTSQGTSLALMIWSFMSGEQPNFELACAISIIILVVVLALNLFVKVIGKRLTKSVN